MDLQTTWLQVQARLDELFWHGGRSPCQFKRPSTVVREQLTAVKAGSSGSKRATAQRLAAQFRGDPLLTSEEQTRLRSLVKDQKDRQTLTKGGGAWGQQGGHAGPRSGQCEPPWWQGGWVHLCQEVCIWFIPINHLICILRTCYKCGKEGFAHQAKV